MLGGESALLSFITFPFPTEPKSTNRMMEAITLKKYPVVSFMIATKVIYLNELLQAKDKYITHKADADNK